MRRFTAIDFEIGFLAMKLNSSAAFANSSSILSGKTNVFMLSTQVFGYLLCVPFNLRQIIRRGLPSDIAQPAKCAVVFSSMKLAYNVPFADYCETEMLKVLPHRFARRRRLINSSVGSRVSDKNQRVLACYFWGARDDFPLTSIKVQLRLQKVSNGLRWLPLNRRRTDTHQIVSVKVQVSCFLRLLQFYVESSCL